MKIDLTIQSDQSCRLSASDFESIASAMASKLEMGNTADIIEVFLVANEKIRQLNKKHRGKDEATDVLSFPQKQFPAGDEQVLGTIFIAPEFVKKESKNCRELFAHGVLHLLGFDHEVDINKWEDAEEKSTSTVSPEGRMSEPRSIVGRKQTI